MFVSTARRPLDAGIEGGPQPRQSDPPVERGQDLVLNGGRHDRLRRVRDMRIAPHPLRTAEPVDELTLRAKIDPDRHGSPDSFLAGMPGSRSAAHHVCSKT